MKNILSEREFKWQRLQTIMEAIQSYCDQCITVPSEWLADKIKLEKELGLREERDAPVKVEKFVWTDELVVKFAGTLRAMDRPYTLDEQIYWFKSCSHPEQKLQAPIKVDAGKEWEIVAYSKDGFTGELKNILFIKDGTGWRTCDFRLPELHKNLYNESDVVGKIHSVKRVSDNQTFTITDEGRTKKFDDKVFVIERFEIIDNTMWVTCKHKYGYESQRDTFKLQHFQKLQSLPETKPMSESKTERIVVDVDGSFDFRTWYKSAYHFIVDNGYRIPKEKFSEIKSAIERVLNNEPELKLTRGLDDMLRPFETTYTQQQMDKAITDAFNEARERNGQNEVALQIKPFMKYEDAADYLKSIYNQK